MPDRPEAIGSRQGDPAPQRIFYLISSQRSGGYMEDPQPRGFRQAPLKPSGFFSWTRLTNLRANVGGVPPGK